LDNGFDGEPVRDTLELINRMQADGVIGRYAIGGAVGATFYLSPSATLDIDIFVAVPQRPGSSLLTLSPIYDYLSERGCASEGEHVIIGKWPVQFLAASNALEEEAIANGVETEVGGVRTWVMTAEHLVAIALSTGRAKDYARIVQFLEQGTVDRNKLDKVLKRHGLVSKWERFSRRYLGE
jgi:hypothetical protein